MLRGRARFTVDGNEHELGPGQLVFVRDPALRRGAVALDADTAVLALGGKPGEAHKVSAWEAMFAAVPASRAEDWDEAIRIHEEALAEQPEHARAALQPRLHGGARRAPARRARCTCSSAVQLEPKWAEYARKDSDFAAIRREPGFPA